MRFLMMVKAGADYEAGAAPAPELMEAIGALAGEGTARIGALRSARTLLSGSRARGCCPRGP
jgi:hypothetical protein